MSDSDFKTWARVDGGVVVELLQLPSNLIPGVDIFAAGLTFLDVTSQPNVVVGWSFENGIFAAPQPVAMTIVQLEAYANNKQWTLATGGYTTTIGGTSYTFATDTTSQVLITGKAVRLAQANPPTTVNWQFATGFATLASADFLSAASHIADFVQATFDVLAGVLAGIRSGAMTTTAAIDAAAWPAS